MDYKNGKPSTQPDIGNGSDLEPAKVTNIENHLKKRQQSPTGKENSATHPFIKDPSLENSYDNSVTYFPNTNQTPSATENTEPPAAIFSETASPPEEELSDLEKRILLRIQNELDQNEQRTSRLVNSNMETSASTAKTSQDALYPHYPQSTVDNNIQPFQAIKIPATLPAPIEVPKETENVDINLLERWLDKTPKAETGYPLHYVIWMCLASLIIGAITGGLATAKFMTVEKLEKIQIEEAYQSYKLMLASRNTDVTSTSINGNSGDSYNGEGSSGNGSGGQKYTGAAALAFSVPIMEEKKECHDKPIIKLTPLPAGQSKISINARCWKRQTINIEYAGIKIEQQLNDDGNLNYILDCFAGDKAPVTFYFDDNLKVTRKPVAHDLDTITKVAVIWKGSANLDLHAFEYMATAGKDGHVWESNPSSFKKAKYKTRQTGQGHGFISSSENFGSRKQKIEVYTFVNAKNQKHGVVQLALDYKLRGNNLHQITCQSQGDITIDYTTTVLVRNGNIKTNKAASILNPCNLISTKRKMLNARAVEDLVFGR